MHDAGKPAVCHFFGQDAGHIVICRAGVDDQRQASLTRGRDMDAQALFLNFGAVGGVMVIEPGFTDADHLRVLGDFHQFFHRCQRLFCR